MQVQVLPGVSVKMKCPKGNALGLLERTAVGVAIASFILMLVCFFAASWVDIHDGPPGTSIERGYVNQIGDTTLDNSLVWLGFIFMAVMFITAMFGAIVAD